LHGSKHELLYKNPLEIHNDHALGAQQQSLLLNRGGIRSVRLANVGKLADDRVSLKDEPFQDYRCVEPSGVGTEELSHDKLLHSALALTGRLDL
jgi:hypothetical protein